MSTTITQHKRISTFLSILALILYVLTFIFNNPILNLLWAVCTVAAIWIHIFKPDPFSEKSYSKFLLERARLKNAVLQTLDMDCKIDKDGRRYIEHELLVNKVKEKGFTKCSPDQIIRMAQQINREGYTHP